MAGSYFFIKSQLNGLVMDLEGGSSRPGTRVITWNQKHSDNDNQLFYEDHMTGTIRNKMGHVCLDLQGDRITVNHYQPGNMNQQWMIAGTRIQSRTNPNSVLDIANGDSNPGAYICAWNWNGGANQQWHIEPAHTSHHPPHYPGHHQPPHYPGHHQPPHYPVGHHQPPHYPGHHQPSAPPMPPRNYVYIQSELNRLVLDVEGGARHAGARVLMWNQKQGSDAANQHFYEDHMTGTIRSKLNDFCLDIQGDSLVLTPFQPGNMNQQWMISGNRIQNRTNPNSVLDIANNDASPGAKVGAWPYNGGRNQHWRTHRA